MSSEKVKLTPEQIEDRKNAKPKAPDSAAILRSYLAKYDQRDLRFAYFKSRKVRNVYITAVSVRHRDNNTVTVAFAFSSIKDSFCKKDGKNGCFKRLEEPDDYVVTVDWLGDGLLSIFYAYNEIKNKPFRLEFTRFNDLIPAAMPRNYIVALY